MRCCEVRDLVLTGKAYNVSTKGNLQVEMDVQYYKSHSVFNSKGRSTKEIMIIFKNQYNVSATKLALAIPVFEQLAEQQLICLKVQLAAVG